MTMTDENPPKEQIILRAKSSSGEPYTVTITRLPSGKLTAFCDCPAGIRTKYCKHKWGILQGDVSSLHDSPDSQILAKLEKWIAKTSFSTLYKRANEIEEQIAVLKKLHQLERKRVEGFLRTGF